MLLLPGNMSTHAKRNFPYKPGGMGQRHHIHNPLKCFRYAVQGKEGAAQKRHGRYDNISKIIHVVMALHHHGCQKAKGGKDQRIQDNRGQKPPVHGQPGPRHNSQQYDEHSGIHAAEGSRNDMAHCQQMHPGG